MDRWPRRSLFGATLHWLVTIQYAGTVVRLADDHLDVESDDGWLHYDGALIDPIALETILGDPGTLSDPPSVSVSAVWPVNVPLLVSRGHEIAGAEAEVAQWREGDPWEQRRVVLLGRLADPEYGAEDEPVTCSIEESMVDDAGIIPDPAVVLSTTAWPGVVDAALGLACPTILGQPGSAGSAAVPATPAYMVVQTPGSEKVLVAGHRVDATYVCIFAIRGDARLSIPLPVIQDTDGLGRTVTTVDISGTGLAFDDMADDGSGTAVPVSFADPSNTFYAAWGDAAGGSGGGLVDRQREGGLRRAGGLLQWMLEQSTLRWDRGRMAAAATGLDAFFIDSVIEEGVSPAEWVTSTLLRLLPVALMPGPQGIRPVVWRWTARPSDAVVHIDIDTLPDAERLGPMTADTSAIYNRFDLRYALDNHTGEMTRHVLLDATRDASDPETAESLLCRVSQARYGVRTLSTEAHVVYDPATAGRIVRSWAASRCFPGRRLRYALPPELRWLDLGDVVTLSDQELYLADQVCLVAGIRETEEDRVEVTLRLVDDPTRRRA